MIIDIICILLLVVAIFKGISKGLIIAVFSFAAFIIGLAAALKLSATVATYLREHTKTDSSWLPVISFAIVFIGVAILVRWVAKLLKGAVNLALLGWVDRLGGALLYILLYMMVFSIILFYATQIRLISPAVQSASNTYHLIEPWGPWVIDGIGKVVPLFQDIFSDLEHFFEGVTKK